MAVLCALSFVQETVKSQSTSEVEEADNIKVYMAVGGVATAFVGVTALVVAKKKKKQPLSL